MKYKIWYDEDNGIMRAEIFEKFDVEDTSGFFDYVDKNFTDEQKRYLLAYVAEAAQDLPSKETRRSLRENAPAIQWDRIGLWGAKPGLRMLVKIILVAAGKTRNTKFFATEEEALVWLKTEKKKDKK